MHDSEKDGQSPVEVDRRGFLGWASMAVAGLVGLVGGVVAIVYASAPALKNARTEEAGWTAVPGTPSAEPTRHSVAVVSDAGWAKTQAGGAVFLDRSADGKITCFSARCPHEGCQVEWSGDSKQYRCPCHASVWTRDGSRVEGPTKRGLDPLEIRTTPAGDVEVKYVSFALDTADRIQVG
jgi:cytochrome b6-f complex iron-sulfur subunit/menaquinol-cytochrome c reductase iron-sulfur subunit